MFATIVFVLGASVQPSTTPQPEFVACPSGVWVRSGQPCPAIGPHPTYVYFDAGQAALDARGVELLEYFAANMRRRQSAGLEPLPFLIEGHADHGELGADAVQLSRRRAEAVRDFLVARGHPARLLPIVYFGVERPMRETADEIPHPDNRRAVIRHIDRDPER